MRRCETKLPEKTSRRENVAQSVILIEIEEHPNQLSILNTFV